MFAKLAGNVLLLSLSSLCLSLSLSLTAIARINLTCLLTFSRCGWIYSAFKVFCLLVSQTSRYLLWKWILANVLVIFSNFVSAIKNSSDVASPCKLIIKYLLDLRVFEYIARSWKDYYIQYHHYTTDLLFTLKWLNTDIDDNMVSVFPPFDPL